MDGTQEVEAASLHFLRVNKTEVEEETNYLHKYIHRHPNIALLLWKNVPGILPGSFYDVP